MIQIVATIPGIYNKASRYCEDLEPDAIALKDMKEMGEMADFYQTVSNSTLSFLRHIQAQEQVTCFPSLRFSPMRSTSASWGGAGGVRRLRTGSGRCVEDGGLVGVGIWEVAERGRGSAVRSSERRCCVAVAPKSELKLRLAPDSKGPDGSHCVTFSSLQPEAMVYFWEVIGSIVFETSSS